MVSCSRLISDCEYRLKDVKRRGLFTRLFGTINIRQGWKRRALKFLTITPVPGCYGYIGIGIPRKKKKKTKKKKKRNIRKIVFDYYRQYAVAILRLRNFLFSDKRKIVKLMETKVKWFLFSQNETKRSIIYGLNAKI